MADTVVPITNDQETDAVNAAQAVAQIQGAGPGTQSLQGQTSAVGDQAANPDALSSDSAQLSETAQVVLLEEQGLTISEIAQHLGIPQTEVESDLEEVVSAQQSVDTQAPGAATYTQVAGI